MFKLLTISHYICERFAWPITCFSSCLNEYLSKSHEQWRPPLPELNGCEKQVPTDLSNLTICIYTLWDSAETNTNHHFIVDGVHCLFWGGNEKILTSNLYLVDYIIERLHETSHLNSHNSFLEINSHQSKKVNQENPTSSKFKITIYNFNCLKNELISAWHTIIFILTYVFSCKL